MDKKKGYYRKKPRHQAFEKLERADVTLSYSNTIPSCLLFICSNKKCVICKWTIVKMTSAIHFTRKCRSSFSFDICFGLTLTFLDCWHFHRQCLFNIKLPKDTAQIGGVAVMIESTQQLLKKPLVARKVLARNTVPLTYALKNRRNQEQAQP